MGRRKQGGYKATIRRLSKQMASSIRVGILGGRVTRFESLPKQYAQGTVREGIVVPVRDGERQEYGGSVTVVLDYEGAASKNRRLTVKAGRIRGSAEHDRFWGQLTGDLQSQCLKSGVAFESGRVIEVDFVLEVGLGDYQKRFDAANLVDGGLDAVSAAIGVDDQWFDGSWKRVRTKNERTTIKVTVRQASNPARLDRMGLLPDEWTDLPDEGLVGG